MGRVRLTQERKRTLRSTWKLAQRSLPRASVFAGKYREQKELPPGKLLPKSDTVAQSSCFFPPAKTTVLASLTWAEATPSLSDTPLIECVPVLQTSLFYRLGSCRACFFTTRMSWSAYAGIQKFPDWGGAGAMHLNWLTSTRCIDRPTRVQIMKQVRLYFR